jgi:hypothetical protein
MPGMNPAKFTLWTLVVLFAGAVLLHVPTGPLVTHFEFTLGG